jgi:hypothetical protein
MVPTEENQLPEEEEDMLNKLNSDVSSKLLPEIIESKSFDPMWDLYLQ